MTIRAGFAGTIGRTPLIRLGKFSEETGCEILGKAEFMNPGGSVKDRAARGILEVAERDGRSRPGGTLVEGTAGNTGIGFVHLCNERGYRCVIVMPDNQSPEKAALLRTLGADVRIVKTVPYSRSKPLPEAAARLADELPDAVWGNQFDNTANRDAHYATTGPEIWQQTSGGISAFVCATGTGGTLGGVSRYLKTAAMACAACWRTRSAARCITGSRPGSSSRRLERGDRGHRHRPRDGQSRGAPIDDAVHDRGPGDRAHGLPAAARGRACSWAARAASTSRRPCASLASSARATRS